MSSHPQCIPQNFIHFGLYDLEVPAGTDDPAGTMFFFIHSGATKQRKKKQVFQLLLCLLGTKCQRERGQYQIKQIKY